MKDKSALPRKKLRLLGNLLLVVACLGLVAAVALVDITISLSAPSEYSEYEAMVDEILLPEGITADTTVRELLEKDHAFFDQNRGIYRALSFVMTAFVLIFSAIFLYLALAWRRADPFGSATVIGLRCLGALLIVRFFVGWATGVFAPLPVHGELFFHSDVYQLTVDMLADGGPILSSGILFLILSWVLAYGRNIKEEQALTI